MGTRCLGIAGLALCLACGEPPADDPPPEAPSAVPRGAVTAAPGAVEPPAADTGAREAEGQPGLPAAPEWDGVDLDCRDVGRPVAVPGDDPHGLDRDRDGVGCESW